jgi:mannose-6-phosphate isomerase-like protein (cupin superfamily)
MQSRFDGPMPSVAADTLADRLVRYADLRPCSTAFIDARTPGSDRKENFTIIGPGVAENPDQHVHIEEPHGFNIGAARQPPRCVNSQHVHATAEVFLAHSGTWAFRAGEHADEGEVVIGPGDVISLPTGVFRGFENIGQDTGFLYSVLGGDDPGRVLWAPDVLERAAGHGLLLMENGRLVDTVKGERPAPGETPVRPESREALSRLVRHIDSAGLAQGVARADAAFPAVAAFAGPGVDTRAVIGGPAPDEGAAAGPLGAGHGFSCRWLTLAPGAQTRRYARAGSEVLFVHSGRARITVEGQTLDLGPGDTFSAPAGAPRQIAATSEPARLFVTLDGDPPPAPVWA